LQAQRTALNSKTPVQALQGLIRFPSHAFHKPPYDRSVRCACKEKMMNKLTLHPVNDQVVRVLSSQGECVGNLKLIGAVWKFKAIGHDADGAVIPGGGPLTDRHNTRFAVLDEAVVNAALTGF
jgi:hypothetical protein